MTCYTCWAGLTAIISIGDFVGSCCNNGNNFDNICKKENIITSTCIINIIQF